MGRADAFGHPGQTGPDQQVDHEADAQGFPDEKTADDAEADGRGELEEAFRRKGNARIGQCKDGHDEEGIPRSEGMLPAGQRGAVLRLCRAGRGQEAHQDTGYGGVNAGMMEGKPESNAACEIEEGGTDVPAGGSPEEEHDHDGRTECGEGGGVTVKQRKDDDAAQIIHNGQSGQEYGNAFRDAFGGKGEYAEGKGNIGGHGNGPAGKGGKSRIECKIEQGGNDHASRSSRNGQDGGGKGFQFAEKEFPLDFQSDHEEEEDHQSVIDPVQDRHGQPGDGNFRVKELGVQAGCGGIGNEHGNHCAEEQQDAACRFLAEEIKKGLTDPLNAAHETLLSGKIFHITFKIINATVSISVFRRKVDVTEGKIKEKMRSFRKKQFCGADFCGPVSGAVFPGNEHKKPALRNLSSEGGCLQGNENGFFCQLSVPSGRTVPFR